MTQAFATSGVFPPGAIVLADEGSIRVASAVLRAGRLVGMPTETVYGLAADACNGPAVAAIYEAKGRPQFNPLISHVADVEAARRHGILNADAERLAAAFWPGPLTLVVPVRPGSAISDLARAGLDTVALRVPGHPVARALIEAFGGPVAAPSANLSGRISPTSAQHVQADLGAKVALILDGGTCDVGVESTVLACLDGDVSLLRPGGIARESVEQVLGRSMVANSGETFTRSPGLLLSHYAPIAPVQLNVISPTREGAILAFGKAYPEKMSAEQPFLNLSTEGDLRQAAVSLFSSLRHLDALNPSFIAVTPIPYVGLGEAINDRLARAAAPRTFQRPG